MKATRRRTVLGALAALASAAVPAQAGDAAQPRRQWYEAAEAMRKLAESWGDESYGAVLVLDGRIVGVGPSRVVRNADPTAHAEREAIHDAQRKLGRSDLSGAVLYSTSRPCALCQQVAAQARVARMIHGASLTDAGVP